MPFIAIDPDDSHPRIPTGVKDFEEVECPICGGVMRVREGDHTARHFYHPPESGDSCETPLHLHMKAIALGKLKEAYPDSTVDIEIRAKDAPRRADVYVEFIQPRSPFGRGIAVEVQHLNDQKDITGTTADYLLDGSSVMWLFEENYAGSRPEYEDVELPSPVPVWPFAVPRGNTSSKDVSSEDYLGITEADLLDVLPNHVDGQISLTGFSSGAKESKESQTEELPEWSRKKEIDLNLSITTPGVRDVYGYWLKGLAENGLEKHRKRIQSQLETAKLGKRRTYLSKRFFEGDSDTFEFSIEAYPSGGAQFYIRLFSGGEEHEIESPIGEGVVEGLSELLAQISYEMECVRRTSSDNWSHTDSVDGALCNFSYSMVRRENGSVVVDIQEPLGSYAVRPEPVEFKLEFCDQHLSKLLDLCQEMMLWREISNSAGTSK